MRQPTTTNQSTAIFIGNAPAKHFRTTGYSNRSASFKPTAVRQNLSFPQRGGKILLPLAKATASGSRFRTPLDPSTGNRQGEIAPSTKRDSMLFWRTERLDQRYRTIETRLKAKSPSSLLRPLVSSGMLLPSPSAQPASSTDPLLSNQPSSPIKPFLRFFLGREPPPTIKIRCWHRSADKTSKTNQKILGLVVAVGGH